MLVREIIDGTVDVLWPGTEEDRAFLSMIRDGMPNFYVYPYPNHYNLGFLPFTNRKGRMAIIRLISLRHLLRVASHPKVTNSSMPHTAAI